MLYFALLFILCFLFITFLTWNNILVKTSTMAIVMALGIITNGVLANYFGIENMKNFGKLLSILNISLWIAFFISFILAFRDKQFLKIHYENPINRFGIGTWVAGTSICGILIVKNLPEWILLVKYMTFVNILLWVTYIVISIFALREMSRSKLLNSVHGILLLTTVSTQSIVLELNTVFKGEVSFFTNVFLISVGIGFYLISVVLIINRYVGDFRTLNIEVDWKNTNCILHGAVSITGLACIFSNIASQRLLSILWIIAASIFFVVEIIELYRVIKRIKRLGLVKGIFVYDVTQWSRVFTFGMFYAFTFKSFSEGNILAHLQSIILQDGVWVVLSLIIIEIILFIRSSVVSYTVSRNEVRGISV